MRSKPWTAKEIELLGTDLDLVIAERLGRTPGAVKRRRWELKIGSFHVGRHAWTDAEIVKLGTVPDAELARALGIGQSTVMRARKRFDIEPCCPHNTPKKWRTRPHWREKPKC